MSIQFYSFGEIYIMFIWKMSFITSNNYTTKIRQICSEVTFVHIVLISLDSL